jgi:alkylation response protein AidB-like acyl-CoA dehydrogenase
VNFDLSETQELFQSTAERFTRDVDVAAREKIRSLSDGYDKNRWNQLTELGLLAIIANDEQGGLGGNLADLSVIAETLGANNALDPWLENGALPIRILSIANHRDGLEAALNENKIVALAFSEPNSRYNLFPNASQATKNADNSYTLTGEKQFVMGGAIADKLLVSANERDTFRLFCIDRSNPALQPRIRC